MYKLPDIGMLPTGGTQATEDSEQTVEQLTETFASFKVGARVVDYVRGPMVTRYEVELAPGTPVRKVESLKANIAYTVGSNDIRIVSPIPGKSAIGIEIPNSKRDMVQLRDVLDSIDSDKPYVTGFGQGVEGDYVDINITKLPHLLVAGATGSGKSVFLNTIICSVLLRAMPWEVQFMMVDPKRVELAPYAEIPHLMCPIITDPTEAGQALRSMCKLMDKRYTMFEESGTKDIDGYNKAKPDEPMPRIFVIVDEMADLMMIDKDGVEASIIRLSQLARAAGIHLILATQRPTVQFVTGAIKSNMPARLSFNVSTGVDSRVILDMNGAQDLLGMGDSLYLGTGASEPKRVQGAWISETSITQIANHWRHEVYRVASATETVEPATESTQAEQETYRPRHASPATDAATVPPPPPPPPTNEPVVVPKFYTQPGQQDKDKSEGSPWLDETLKMVTVLVRFTYTICYVTVFIAVQLIACLCGTRGMAGEAMYTNLRGSQIFGSRGGGGGSGSSMMGSSRGGQQSRVQNTHSESAGLNGDLFD